MSNTTGNFSRGKSFAATEPAGQLDVRQLLMLLGLGVGIVLLHEMVRFHLKLPGHHGLEAMALMAFGRMTAPGRWSASLVGAAAATTAVAFSAGNGPLQPVFYLLPGLVLDLAWRLLPAWRKMLFLVPLIGGLAWASRPLVRWMIAQTSGLEFQSVAAGLAWPVFTHLVFGTIGAAAATVAWYQWQKRHGPAG